MLVDDVSARIEDQVEALAGRVQGALELSELLRRKALPQATPFAFVAPGGLTPRGDGEAAANAFTQMFDEHVSVVLVVRTAGDVTGAKSQPKLDQLMWSVVTACSGFEPDEAIGVLRLRRARVLELTAGTVFLQIDFAIQRQIRILS